MGAPELLNLVAALAVHILAPEVVAVQVRRLDAQVALLLVVNHVKQDVLPAALDHAAVDVQRPVPEHVKLDAPLAVLVLVQGCAVVAVQEVVLQAASRHARVAATQGVQVIVAPPAQSDVAAIVRVAALLHVLVVPARAAGHVV